MDIHGLDLSITESVGVIAVNLRRLEANDWVTGYCGNSLSAGSALSTSGNICNDPCLGNPGEYVSLESTGSSDPNILWVQA